MTCTQQEFERDVAQHTMSVIRDSGIDRHLMFRRPDGSPYWFEILTWPGSLCICGDMGTYVFSRLTDMFEFFRTDDRRDPAVLYINKSYWCEKLRATSCDGYGKGAAKRFDAGRFQQRVKERFDDYFAEREITDERSASLWDEIQSDVLDYVTDTEGGGGEAFRRLNDFHDDEFPRLFEDSWEWNCDDYTFHFVWCLYAIAWAIRQYDAAKADSRPQEKEAA